MNFNVHGWVYMKSAALNVDITPVSPVEKGKNKPSLTPVRTDSCQKRLEKEQMAPRLARSIRVNRTAPTEWKLLTNMIS